MTAGELKSPVFAGFDYVLTDPARLAPYATDYRALYKGRPLAVAVPRSVGEVSALLAFCNEQRIAVVPCGGNTSYCGGATPDPSGTQLVVSFEKLNKIHSADPQNYSITVGAGCRLADVQRAAERVNRYFPLTLGSEGTCQIGGNLSTNAGGTTVVRYGMTRDLVLGLEVVVADGRILSSLSPLRKDNTGYDVKSLFLGAEGTLGIITAATLKLFPIARSEATAFVAVPNVESAVELFNALRESSGDLVSTFELIPRVAVEMAAQHVPDIVCPLSDPSLWYVLCELTTSRLDDNVNDILVTALEAGLTRKVVLEATVAQSERERLAMWRLREAVPEAQRRHGLSAKHDISVPIAMLPMFYSRASLWVTKKFPDAVIVAYGHVGDGNLHFNLSQASGTNSEAFLEKAASCRRAIHDIAHECGGSFSAEHGIGRLNVEELARYTSPVELSLMHSIKQAFDPNNILNPGKVLQQ